MAFSVSLSARRLADTRASLPSLGVGLGLWVLGVRVQGLGNLRIGRARRGGKANLALAAFSVNLSARGQPNPACLAWL